MEMLQEKVKEYSDEFLLKQFFNHKDEYQPDALELIKKELEVRNIDHSSLPAAMKSIKLPEIKTYKAEDFIEFDHTFSSIDILLASSILRDSEVAFFVDHVSDSSLPIESKAAEVFKIKVHHDYIEKSHELLDEHFEKKDGRYLLKINTPRERLKAFSFSDIRLSEQEDKPFLSVSLSSDERVAITKYGRRLLDEVDTIESENDRVIFYYDSIEDLIDLLNKKDTISIHKSQLLAILEILQVYCDDAEYPSFLDETSSNILGFFIGS
ncbi:MAG TPA: hypothetical protein VHO70_09775 [Chitinispirillaceae bacterium]|nr:hypothetical protein [Chitinispirillaceae bacterium]